MQCCRKKDTPYDITSGSATIDSNTAYFRSGWTGSLHTYSINHDEWAKPPQPPCTHYGLVCIEGQLTTVGGMRSGWFGTINVTGQLFSLQDGKWKERYPPLNTARSSPAVVSTSYDGHDYIIVAGGKSDGGNWITSVEVLSNNKWSHKTDLPDGLQLPSATVSNTTLYVISKYDFIGYSISLRELLVDSQPMKFPLTLPWTRLLPLPWTQLPLPWKQLPRLPMHYTTPVSICGEFLIVGGRDGNGKLSSAIYQLWNNQFVEVDHVAEAKRWCLAVTPSPDKMVVVGGFSRGGMISHTVEEVSVV